MLLGRAAAAGRGAEAAPQTEERAALALLQTADTLPPCVNGPGEAVAEAVRGTLGELLLCCAAARVWAAEARDALADRVSPPRTLAQLSALEAAGAALRVADGGTLRQLRAALAEAAALHAAVESLGRPAARKADRPTLAAAQALARRAESLPPAAALHGFGPALSGLLAAGRDLQTAVWRAVHRQEIAAVRPHRSLVQG
jgi:hypothetical protein